MMEMARHPFPLDEIPQFLLRGREFRLPFARAVIRLDEVQVEPAFLLVNQQLKDRYYCARCHRENSDNLLVTVLIGFILFFVIVVPLVGIINVL